MALALALLVVGGLALVNALTSSDTQGPPGAQSPTPTSTGGSSERPTSTAATPLVIQAVGGSTLVTITVPGSNDVVFRGTLYAGEGRQYDQAPLNVVANDAGAVRVTIYGKVEERAGGQRGTWFVPEK
ncbi:hypothetical protein [Actinomadura flavalba]|uniref:hypothetical protein n=1 Tax=Actinomadura flavalba TaxID=1120938 RepID=UPI0003623121|nr:hypothetical protein [Actinomadura flavalba]